MLLWREGDNKTAPVDCSLLKIINFELFSHYYVYVFLHAVTDIFNLGKFFLGGEFEYMEYSKLKQIYLFANNNGISSFFCGSRHMCANNKMTSSVLRGG